ncbi:MAG: hypothetical protein Fur0034_06460 [Desulfuromonadia bacterium]
MPCHCGEKHEGHLCVLRSKGMTKEIEQLTDRPEFVCFMCGAEANSAENLCEPVSISR